MDKVAETSVTVERKAEQSAEVSEPKTISPDTRKRPASKVDAETVPDANCDRGEGNGNDGASEPKKSKKQGRFAKAIAEFDEARSGVKKEWERASGKGLELSTLIRDTEDWNDKKLNSDVMNCLEFGQQHWSNPDLKERYEELKELVFNGSHRYDALTQLTRDAIEMVRDCQCEEDLLEQMNGLTKRLHEMRESNWVRNVPS